jgi:membrane protease YdiL (CAAX protease family)
MQPRQPPIRQAMIFVPLAFAISWICWLPVAMADHGIIGSISSEASAILVILGTFGPFVAALTLVSRMGGSGALKEFLGQALRWRAGLQWYLAALVVPFAIRFIVLEIHMLKGGSVPSFFSLAVWLNVPITFVTVLLVGGPTGEEFGWRGFLLQRVQSVYGMLWASFALGVIASLWHLPLFFISGTAQSHIPYVLFAVRTISLSYVSTWLYNGSKRSLLFVLLFHASLNTWPNTVFLLETDGSIGPYISTTIIYAGWACQLFLLGLLRGRADRRGDRKPAPPVAA